ncbi:MAG: AsmA family protein [Myxococcota bacterium]|nr:AsmA family protein [Myxococcota bacterium]
MRSRKRWLWLAVPLGVVCAVLAGVAAIVVRELDVERQERRISQVISDFTGREVDIRGGLEIGLSWRPTLVARDVSISNAAWGSQPTMLSADRVEVTLSLERLLSGSIDLVRVALSGVRLLLETDARGARNWDLEAADSDEAAVPLGHDFFAENVVIEDLELRIRGPGSTGDAPIEIPRISVATETFEQPIEFKLRARPAGTEFSATGTIGSLQEWMDGSRVPFALDLRWGGSRFSIEAALDLGERPRLKGRILSGRVDLQSWFGERPQSSGTGGRLFPSAPLGLKGLVSSNADIQLVVDRVVDERARLEIRHAELALRGEVLRVDSAQILLSGARVDASMEIDGRRTEPRVQFSLLTHKLDFGTLLRRLGVNDEIAAIVDLRANLRGTGDSVAALLGSLDGDLATSVTRGQIPTAYVSRLVSNLPSLLMPWAQPAARVDIECAGARFSILRGVARTQDLMLDTSRLTIRAAGEFDLGAETLSFTLAPRPRDHNLLTLATDINLSGSLRDPSAFPHPIDLLGSAARLALGPVRVLSPFRGTDATRRAECAEHTRNLVGGNSGGG